MRKNAFTLVEILAVIVILGLLLVIVVPKITQTIQNSKKRTLELTARTIAKTAEEKYIENETFGLEEEITCDSIAGISNKDYSSCNISFDEEGNALVTIKGSGQYNGLYICNGTKTNSIATSEECGTSGVKGVNAVSYITELLDKEETLQNGLVQTTAEYDGKIYNAGIRYVGPLTGDNAVKNQVYFNCESIDGTNAYESANYDYANNCEIWRIIGVFEVTDENGDTAQRLKIINTNSTFQASWDSSADGTQEGETAINGGNGINQWGPSGDYNGADLMQLLNGYYIGKPNSECKYNNVSGQAGFGQTCTTESLVAAKMKPLTSVALSMATSAVWDTYAVSATSVKSSNASTAYLQEKGIRAQYTGSSECVATSGVYCNDGITRTTSWTGLVGLMSVSDIGYANGWLYNNSIYPWSISQSSSSSHSNYVWYSGSPPAYYSVASQTFGVWPALYLDSNIQIIGGDGDLIPYKLNIGD